MGGEKAEARLESFHRRLPYRHQANLFLGTYPRRRRRAFLWVATLDLVFLVFLGGKTIVIKIK